MFRKCLIATIIAIHICLFLSTSAFAHVDHDVVSNNPVFANKTSKSEISERLMGLHSIIEVEVTDEVHERINQYTYHYRKSAENILNRVMIYFPVFEKEIHRRGLPDELKYLAVVESMLDPNAKSKAGATGLWQFIKGTAKMVGLEVNSVVDERRSIEKSTQAALDYLQSLYDRFGDWNLAIAAYNCGPGNVSKALKKSNSTNFWEIRKHLPQETQKYLPRFIAAMYLMNFYHYHGLTTGLLDRDMLDVTMLNVEDKISLKQLSKTIDVNYETIKLLNPEYLRGYIPQSKGRRTLRIPTSKLEVYYKNYDLNSYNKLLQKRIEQAAEIERKHIKLIEKRDTVRSLEKLVTLIYNSIQSIGPKKTYNIPRGMRSGESWSNV